MPGLPLLPVAATLAVQALGTMSVFAVPVMAPAVSLQLGVSPSWVGLYTSLIYVGATVAAVLCPGWIARWGGIRLSQLAMLATAAGLAAAAAGSIAALLLSALIIGPAYAVPIPAASQVLVRHTPPPLYNLVFSIRQAGVPIGGMAAGALVPHLLLSAGWQAALVVLAAAPLLLACALHPLHRRFDETDRSRRLLGPGMLQPLILLYRLPGLRRLGIAGLLYASMEVAYAAFIVVSLVERVDLGFVEAGAALAVFQAGGLAGRIGFGMLATRRARTGPLLSGLGFAMALSGLAAAAFSPEWSRAAVFGACFVTGVTSGGWTGVGVAEAARLGAAAGPAAATGALSMAMFVGVIVGPGAFALIVAAGGGYPLAYAVLAAGAAAGGLLISGRRGVTP